MTQRVWLNLVIHPEALTRLRQVAKPVGPFAGPSDDPLVDLAGVHGVIVSSTPQVDGTFMDRAGPQLRVIARAGIGLDNIDVETATTRDIAVVHTPDGPTEPTAEHAVALMLALAKRLLEADRQLRQHGFAGKKDLMGAEVAGKTLGLVGIGRIGGRVATIARALNMRVLAYDPYASAGRAAVLGVELMDSLDDLLSRADFVSLHTPLTPETHHMIDSKALSRMKPTAYLINCARGPVVDPEALLVALRKGTLKGAGLDVFEPEPTGPDNPLFELPNVIVTPHIASNTQAGMWRMSMGAVQQVLDVLAGRRPQNLVNPEIWRGNLHAG